MDRTHTEVPCCGWWEREEKKGEEDKDSKDGAVRIPSAYAHRVRALTCLMRRGDAAQLPGRQGRPWCIDGVRGGAHWAVCRPVCQWGPWPGRWRSLHVSAASMRLVSGRTRMKGGFLGLRGPGGGGRPLSPC